MKQKILRYMTEQDGYVSGQKLSEKLGVSRTAVWKCIKILRQEGYEIESQTRRGYRLTKRPDLLSRDEILRNLQETNLQGEIRVLPVVDSTNEEAKRAFMEGCPDRSLFVADRQTAGKGRRGRVWLSPGGEDVFFSLLLKPDLPPECASMITLIAALAGVAALRRQVKADFLIKWPNDIVLHRKKICGILTEMSADMDRIHYIVTGSGFNLNRHEFEDSIQDMASSVFLETGKKISRSHFVADYVKAFMERYEKFLAEQDLRSFVEEYNLCLINTGREVKLIRRGEEQICKALGINEKGELLVENPDGKTETVFSGEVSVRGLYGYV